MAENDLISRSEVMKLLEDVIRDIRNEYMCATNYIEKVVWAKELADVEKIASLMRNLPAAKEVIYG